MSALMERYEPESIAFINGDHVAAEVRFPDGATRNLSERREDAAQRFKVGSARFLISTEAGGEGIDLQDSCHTLIHVDLPWNPMRMHQRVGRLNRYGQTRQVEVLTFRNPATVESRIWDKLNEKLERISRALGQVMDEPEDMLELVLGMTSPAMFRDLFTRARIVPTESLSNWFDQETAQFGGKDIISIVQELVGNASKFDFQQVSGQLPQVDLPALKPFLETALALNGRRFREDPDGFSFLTPDCWKVEPLIRNEYLNMTLNRRAGGSDLHKRLMGVGTKVIDLALKQACGRSASVASIPPEILQYPLAVFRLRDRVTGGGMTVRSILVGVELRAPEPDLLYDWQILVRLNEIPMRRTLLQDASSPALSPHNVGGMIERAEDVLKSNLESLEHNFRYPVWDTIALLLPQTSP